MIRFLLGEGVLFPGYFRCLISFQSRSGPDTLFISPFVGNCQIIDRLMGTGTIKPKIVYMPFNPLIEPSYNEKPDFFAWWNEHRPAQNTAFSTLLVTRGDHELFRWCVIIALITSGVCDHESRIQKVNLFHRVRLSTIGVFFFFSLAPGYEQFSGLPC